MAEANALQQVKDRAVEAVEERLGGAARVRVIGLLACVLAVEAADLATVGAAAQPIERAFDLTYFQIGLLVSVTLFMAAVFTLPFGIAADRVNRTRLLAGAIVVWCLAEAAAGAAGSYLWLVLARLGLGAVTAAAQPCIASLVGDYFPGKERSRIYGWILGGELVGAGIGFGISGNVASLTWRMSFWWLIIPGLVVAWAVWKHLPEPARGGSAQARDTEEAAGEQQAGARKVARERHIEPNRALVLDRDPTRMGIWRAVRYVLSIHTNVILIVASALGYFFFSGVRTLGVIYIRGHYGLGQSGGTSILLVVGIGALAGVLVGGQIADWLLGRGHISVRIALSGAVFLVAVLFFAPGIYTTSLWIAIPLFVVGAACLSGANPPLDAARLDIMHSRLWGRAESVRTVLRSILEGVSPLLFGFVADFLSGHNIYGSGRGQQPNPAQSSHGLEYAFLLFLVPLLIAGILTFVALNTYPTDVATAAASEDATRTWWPELCTRNRHMPDAGANPQITPGGRTRMDDNVAGANVGGTLVHDGWDVYSSDDHKVGTIAEAHPEYLLVEKGWLFKKDLYIPMSAVRGTDPGQGCVYLNVYKDQVEAMGWEGMPATEGYETTGSMRGARETDSMQLREEELVARKNVEQAGEVEIGKRVVTEQQTMNVPVTHEEVEIERHPVDRRPADSGISDSGQESIRVPLSREEIEVEKRPVVTEEINVHKTPVTENRTVNETVRREEVTGLEGATDTTTAGVSGSGERLHEHRFVDGRCVDCGHTP